jgi:hypothetical protein
VHVRNLTPEEARALALDIAAGDTRKLQAFAAEDTRKRSLAEIYRELR